MNNPLRDLHEQALCDLEELLGAPTFSFVGITLPCATSSIHRNTMIDWGGRVVTIRFSLIVRRTVADKLPGPLVDGKTILFDGIEYRIARVGTPATGSHLHLDLIDPNT